MASGWATPSSRRAEGFGQVLFPGETLKRRGSPDV